MATNTYYPQLFRCTNPECKHSEKIYVWSNDLTPETFKPCPKCKGEEAMEPEFEEVVEGPSYLKSGLNGKMTESQQAARKARNRKKFKSDGMEQMKNRDTDAFNYHKKKLGYKS